MRSMNIAEKIIAHHAIGLQRRYVIPGETVRVAVDWIIASEIAWNGMNRTYDALGRPPVWNRERTYLAVDHTVDPETLRNDERVRKLVELSRSFAAEARLQHFYDANTTIMHTKFYMDLVQPGQLVAGADSHTSSHGALGALSLGLGGADVCVAMVLGQSWLVVPRVIAVRYFGSPAFGVTGKDVILHTLKALRRNTAALDRVVEYGGPGAASLSTDARFCICNMTAELGGITGIFGVDRRTNEFLATRDGYVNESMSFEPDPDAEYDATYDIDMQDLAPQVAKPFSPDNVQDVTQESGAAFNGVFIGACTTTEEELILAALTLKEGLRRGLAIAPGKRLVVPGSTDVAQRLRAAGLLSIFEKAGFEIGVPGCSMCLGIASARAQPGEHWLSTQNRNFQHRMGRDSHAWLSSAPTAAASSFSMTLTDPRSLIDARIIPDVASLRRASVADVRVRVAEPKLTMTSEPIKRTTAVTEQCGALSLRGRVQRFADNVDTDAIIPGEYLHLNDMTQLAAGAFRYVRPEFHERIRAGGTIIVADEGWGCGSSREHAAWALKYAGIIAVIARSVAFIHARNLINEGIPLYLIRDQLFYQAAEEGVELTIDNAEQVVQIAGRTFPLPTTTGYPQRIVSCGGIVPAVRRYGAEALASG